MLAAERSGKRNEEVLSTVGSVLGGLLGGRRSRGGALGQLGRAAGREDARPLPANGSMRRRTRSTRSASSCCSWKARCRTRSTAIDVRWSNVAKEITTVDVPLGTLGREGDPAGARLAAGRLTVARRSLEDQRRPSRSNSLSSGAAVLGPTWVSSHAFIVCRDLPRVAHALGRGARSHPRRVGPLTRRDQTLAPQQLDAWMVPRKATRCCLQLVHRTQHQATFGDGGADRDELGTCGLGIDRRSEPFELIRAMS